MNDKQVELPNGMKILLNNLGNYVSGALSVPVGHSNTPMGLAALFEGVLCREFPNVQAVQGGTITSYLITGDECSGDDVVAYRTLIAGFSKIIKFRDFDQTVIDAVADDIVLHTKDLAPLPSRQMKLLYKHTACDDERKGWNPDVYINAVKSYNVDDLKKLADKYFTGSNIILSLAGKSLSDERVYDDVCVQVPFWLNGVEAGERQLIDNQIYSGGYSRIDPQENAKYRQFMLGWNISNLHNIPEANVLMSMLKGRLERAFSDKMINLEVKIAGYYGVRTLRISVTSYVEDNVNGLIDIVCANIKRLRTELASERRMETSRNRAMSEKLGVFSQPQDRAIEFAWQTLGRGEMYDINERINQTSRVSAHDVREIAQEIFSGRLTYVVYAPSDVYSYEDVMAKL